jgi:hypothetical protein
MWCITIKHYSIYTNNSRLNKVINKIWLVIRKIGKLILRDSKRYWFNKETNPKRLSNDVIRYFNIFHIFLQRYQDHSMQEQLYETNIGQTKLSSWNNFQFIKRFKSQLRKLLSLIRIPLKPLKLRNMAKVWKYMPWSLDPKSQFLQLS